jgi:hypothetical protein
MIVDERSYFFLIWLTYFRAAHLGSLHVGPHLIPPSDATVDLGPRQPPAPDGTESATRQPGANMN